MLIAWSHVLVYLLRAAQAESIPEDKKCPRDDGWQTRPPEARPKKPHSIIKSDRSILTALKYQYNFATTDAGAKVIASSKDTNGVKSVLHPSTDTYMSSNCKASVWFVIALPEKLSIEHLVFETSEAFSAHYGKIAVLGSVEYPTNGWRLMGVVQIDSESDHSVFNLQEPCSKFQNGACWISYLKIQILTYQAKTAGDVTSRICTLSKLQVYGRTLMEGLESKMKTTENQQTAGSESSRSDEPIKRVSKRDSTHDRKLGSWPIRNFSDYIVSKPLLALSPWIEVEQNFANEKKELSGGSTRATRNNGPVKFVNLLPRPSKPSETNLAIVHAFPNLNFSRSLTFDQLAALVDQLLVPPSTSLARKEDQLPPILALADTIDSIHRLNKSNLNKTALVLAGALSWLKSTRNEISNTTRDIDGVIKPWLDTIIARTSGYNTMFQELSKQTCIQSLNGYALFETNTRKAERRVCCVLAAIYSSIPAEVDALIAKTAVGRSIENWNMGYVLNLHITQLKQSVGSGEWSSSFVESPSWVDDPPFVAARLYANVLVSLRWPKTLLHIVRLPEPGLGRDAFTSRPLVLYVTLVLLEGAYTLLLTLMTVSGLLVYLFVVATTFLKAQEHIDMTPVSGTPASGLRDQYDRLLRKFVKRNNANQRRRCSYSEGCCVRPDGFDVLPASQPAPSVLSSCDERD